MNTHNKNHLSDVQLKAMPHHNEIIGVDGEFMRKGRHALWVKGGVSAPAAIVVTPGNPVDKTNYVSTTGIPLFSPSGPSDIDVVQRTSADCYFLAALDSMSYFMPAAVQKNIVQQDANTFLFRFVENGVDTWVKEDGLIPSDAAAIADGCKWVSLYEKAWCYGRSKANTYASIDYGNPYQSFTDLGYTVMAFLPGPAAYTACAVATSKNLPWAILTNPIMPNGIPLTADHCVGGVAVSADAQQITVRDPWGYDGAGGGTIGQDGNFTLSASQVTAGCDYVVVCIAWTPPIPPPIPTPTMPPEMSDVIDLLKIEATEIENAATRVKTAT